MIGLFDVYDALDTATILTAAPTPGATVPPGWCCVVMGEHAIYIDQERARIVRSIAERWIAHAPLLCRPPDPPLTLWAAQTAGLLEDGSYLLRLFALGAEYGCWSLCTLYDTPSHQIQIALRRIAGEAP